MARPRETKYWIRLFKPIFITFYATNIAASACRCWCGHPGNLHCYHVKSGSTVFPGLWGYSDTPLYFVEVCCHSCLNRGKAFVQNVYLKYTIFTCIAPLLCRPPCSPWSLLLSIYRVLYLAMSPDGQTIVTGAGDETLRFWNAFPGPKSREGAGSTGLLFPAGVDIR